MHALELILLQETEAQADQDRSSEIRERSEKNRNL